MTTIFTSPKGYVPFAREQLRCCPLNAQLSAALYASTSLPSVAPRHHQGQPSQAGVCTLAKRRNGQEDWDGLDDQSERDSKSRGRKESGGFHFSNRRGMYRVQYNEYEAEVRQEEAWKLLLPIVGGLVLGAAFIGPLIIGLAFTAVAVGAALSAGALFTSLFLPFFLLIGMGALFFGGLTFSAFATLGTALLLPKLVSLAVGAGGLGLGVMAVSLFQKPAAKNVNGRRSGGESPTAAKTIDVVSEAEPEPENDPEVERQLREFDALLSGREQQRIKAERFKSGGGGGGGGGGAGRR